MYEALHAQDDGGPSASSSSASSFLKKRLGGSDGCPDGVCVVGWSVVGFAVVGFAVVGFAVVGLSVVGLSVVGFSVVGLHDEMTHTGLCVGKMGTAVAREGCCVGVEDGTGVGSTFSFLDLLFLLLPLLLPPLFLANAANDVLLPVPSLSDSVAMVLHDGETTHASTDSSNRKFFLDDGGDG